MGCSSSSFVNFNDQDFEIIKTEHLEYGTLFEDPEFLPDESSIQRELMLPYPPEGEIVWKRPSELCDNPHLIVDGVSRFDVNQGEVGDCWFLAATACMVDHPQLLKRVLPDGQSFEEGDYTGAFHVRFWRNDEWVDVVIDDYLPTIDGKLCFNKSGDPNEMWSALVEKAFAKLNGTYGKIHGGFPMYALEDFSGGSAEVLVQAELQAEDLFETMYEAGQEGAMLTCTTPGEDEGATDEMGMVPGHAYSITKVIKLELDGEEHQLVRVRNPWGDSEWTGEWSDEKISDLPEEVKAEHGMTVKEDGEFYMSIKDLTDQCDGVAICRLPEDLV